MTCALTYLSSRVSFEMVPDTSPSAQPYLSIRR